MIAFVLMLAALFAQPNEVTVTLKCDPCPPRECPLICGEPIILSSIEEDIRLLVMCMTGPRLRERGEDDSDLWGYRRPGPDAPVEQRVHYHVCSRFDLDFDFDVDLKDLARAQIVYRSTSKDAVWRCGLIPVRRAE